MRRGAQFKAPCRSAAPAARTAVLTGSGVGPPGAPPAVLAPCRPCDGSARTGNRPTSHRPRATPSSRIVPSGVRDQRPGRDGGDRQRTETGAERREVDQLSVRVEIADHVVPKSGPKTKVSHAPRAEDRVVAGAPVDQVVACSCKDAVVVRASQKRIRPAPPKRLS